MSQDRPHSHSFPVLAMAVGFLGISEAVLSLTNISTKGVRGGTASSVGIQGENMPSSPAAIKTRNSLLPCTNKRKYSSSNYKLHNEVFAEILAPILKVHIFIVLNSVLTRNNKVKI